MFATKRRRRLTIVGGVLLVLVVLTFTLTPMRRLIDDPADGPAVRADTVTVRDGEFTAPAIEIDAGDTVTWRFEDEVDGEFVAHAVKFDGFRSPEIQQGVYEHRFERPGSYAYSCDLHLLMNGRVDVVAR